MKEALLYQKLENQKVRCRTCQHRCVLEEGKRGICGVRKNEQGKIVSLVYGKAIAVHIDPIEKKPFFHFLPGSTALSIGTVGCNFRCAFCQNWDISQAPKEAGFWHDAYLGEDWPPLKIVTQALKYDCETIAYTYNEPTVFLEYALDTMKEAHQAGLKNIWVSNGYMSSEALAEIIPLLDAINIDLKSFSENFYQEICGATLAPVLGNLKFLKEQGIWIEVTTLLIPGKNDSEKEIKQIAAFIANDLGKETPWHISRFYPAYKMNNLAPTEIGIIEKAVKIGQKAGLKYVYAGNVPGSPYENTYCPACGKILIERVGYIIRRYDKTGYCPNCNAKLDGVFN